MTQDIIWYDAEAYMGRGVKDPDAIQYNTVENPKGPENKRDVPCESACPKFAVCKANAMECSAFRNWAATGNYKDKDVARLLRVA